jgi:hypothetical protein
MPGRVGMVIAALWHVTDRFGQFLDYRLSPWISTTGT